jgi:hypothetical protein
MRGILAPSTAERTWREALGALVTGFANTGPSGDGARPSHALPAVDEER